MATLGQVYAGYDGTMTPTGTYNIDLIPDVARTLTEIDPETPPLITLLAKLPMHVETAINPTYGWDEIQYDEPDIVCASAITAGAPGATQTVTLNTLAVSAGETFYELTTSQEFEVRIVNSQDNTLGTSSVDIIAKPITTGASAVGANSTFVRMGNTMPEGGYYPVPYSKKPVRVTNNIMSMGTQIEVTNIANWSQYYYGSEWDLQKKNAIINLQRNMERQAWWSKQLEETRAVTGSAGRSHTGVVRGTRGVNATLTSKLFAYGPGVIDEATLDSYLASVVWGDFYAGSDLKFGFAGTNFLAGISGFVKNKVRVINSTDKYGLSIAEYVSPVGNRRLYLLEEREFKRGLTPNPSASYANTMYTLDLSYISLVKYGPSLVMVEPSTETGKTSKAIGLSANWGMKVRSERFHSKIYHT